MIKTDQIELKGIALHLTGNPTRGEELSLSDALLDVEDEMTQKLLLRYLVGHFNENERYRFTHLSDIALNEVYSYAAALFENPDSLLEQSRLLAGFLHSKSTHVRIKSGELYVALFDNVPFEDRTVKAIGLCKTENKDSYLQPRYSQKRWTLSHEDGINIQKPDKACLIFHTDTAEGFQCLVVDNTNKGDEAKFWVQDFLQVSPLADSYNQTDKYLSLCKHFITEEYPEKFEVSKTDQADLLNRSIDYFKTHEQFSLQEFAEEVIHHPEVVEAFMDHKRNFQQARQFEIGDEFDIHLAAVKKQQRVFKSVLKLDRNFHIYIHGRRDLIEKGVDETGRKYYKIYYDEES